MREFREWLNTALLALTVAGVGYLLYGLETGYFYSRGSMHARVTDSMVRMDAEQARIGGYVKEVNRVAAPQ